MGDQGAAPRWEHFDHQADVGVRGFGSTVDEAFVQAALAMMHAMVDPDTVRPSENIAVSCEAPDIEVLLVDWLNHIVFEMMRRKMLFHDFEVTINGTTLEGVARGEPVDRTRHEVAVEVKGATFTSLSVTEDAEAGCWIAQCVVDV